MQFEFEVGGKTYRATRLPALDQFHIARRLAPVISSIAGDQETRVSRVGAALAQLSDTDCEYVFNKALANVERMEGTVWSRIWVPAARAAKFEDLNTIGGLLPIVMRVVQENLKDFMNGALTGQTKEAPTQQ